MSKWDSVRNEVGVGNHDNIIFLVRNQIKYPAYRDIIMLRSPSLDIQEAKTVHTVIHGDIRFVVERGIRSQVLNIE